MEADRDAPGARDWDATIPAAAATRIEAALQRLLHKALNGLFVGAVLTILLVLMIVVSVAAGWILIWIPFEIFRMASNGQVGADAFVGDLGAALSEIGGQANNLVRMVFG